MHMTADCETSRLPRGTRQLPMIAAASAPAGRRRVSSRERILGTPMACHLTTEYRLASRWIGPRIAPGEAGGETTIACDLTASESAFVSRLCASMNRIGAEASEKYAAVAELMLLRHAIPLDGPTPGLELAFRGREPSDPPGVLRRYAIRLRAGSVVAIGEGLAGLLAVFATPAC